MGMKCNGHFEYLGKTAIALSPDEIKMIMQTGFAVERAIHRFGTNHPKIDDCVVMSFNLFVEAIGEIGVTDFSNIPLHPIAIERHALIHISKVIADSFQSMVRVRYPLVEAAITVMQKIHRHESFLTGTKSAALFS